MSERYFSLARMSLLRFTIQPTRRAPPSLSLRSRRLCAPFFNERKIKLSPTPIATIMPSNPQTAFKRFRIVAIIFALVAVFDLAVAYDEYRIGERPNSAIAQGVIFLSLSVTFFSLSRRKRREAQSGEETASPKSK